MTLEQPLADPPVTVPPTVNGTIKLAALLTCALLIGIFSPPPANPPSFFAPPAGSTSARPSSKGAPSSSTGNALNTSAADGTMIDIGDLSLGVSDPIASPLNPGR